MTTSVESFSNLVDSLASVTTFPDFPKQQKSNVPLQLCVEFYFFCNQSQITMQLVPYTKSAGNEALKHLDLDVESFLCVDVCYDHLLFDLKKLTRCLSVFKFNQGLGFRERSLASVHLCLHKPMNPKKVTRIPP